MTKLFFKVFIKSIKDFYKYEDFALDSIGKTTVYLFKLIAIFTVIVSILTTYRFSKALNKIEEYIKHEELESVLKYIDIKKKSLNIKKDIANEYMDKLIESLK